MAFLAPLVLPGAAGLLSRLFPAVFFPAPAAGKHFLAECQRLASRAFSLAMAVVALTWLTCLWLLPYSPPPLHFASALKLEVWPLLFYFSRIVDVASRRALDAKAVLGDGFSANVDVMAIRVLNNTTEQLILGVAARLVLATVAPNSTIQIAMVSLWLTGRVLFAAGYSTTNPMGREFGFDLTLASSLSCLVYSVAMISYNGL